MLDSPPPSTITSGIEQVDDLRQPARQPVGVAVQRGLRARFAGGGAGRDGRRRRARPGRRSRARARGRRPRSPGSRAGRTSSAGPAIRRAAARAAGCGPTRRRPGCGPASTLPSTTMPPPQPVPRMTPNTTPLAGAGAVASPREGRSSWRRSPPAPRRPSSAADVAVEGVAVQRDRVGVLHQPGRRADHAGNADADRRGDAELGLGVAHQAGDAVERGRR